MGHANILARSRFICRLAVSVLLYFITTNFSLAEDTQYVKPVVRALHTEMFRHQYTIRDPDFCGSQVCVDFDNDGKREIVFASRQTGHLQLRNAADGKVHWSRKLTGLQQSVSAYDVDGDNDYEILYSVSNPGQLYLLDHTGKLLNTYHSDDHKLGNAATIIDGDQDGTLDAYFGSRSRSLIRLDLQSFKPLKKRAGWIQCGCYTTAKDVDGDGKWDLFAGSGDDHTRKGVLHRIDPVTLQSVWSYPTNDNASSADPVLVDLDGDGLVEIIKSVDNFKQDDAHDAVFAFRADGTLLWKVDGLSGEDSPNVADLDHDGRVEIVGMTFGGEVYCLNAEGKFKWRRNLRPELNHTHHMYMTPILCDLNGDADLEILAMTNAGYAIRTGDKSHAKIYALNAQGQILDMLDLGEPRFWGQAFVCNIDSDPYLELVVSGTGGCDVIETKGLGPDNEHFQRRRNYQRLNVVPWCYEDSYFIYRGLKQNVVNRTDNLILKQKQNGYLPQGRFITKLLTLPPGCAFRKLRYESRLPAQTRLTVNILDQHQNILHKQVSSGTDFNITAPVHLEFVFQTADLKSTPVLDSYQFCFETIK